MVAFCVSSSTSTRSAIIVVTNCLARLRQRESSKDHEVVIAVARNDRKYISKRDQLKRVARRNNLPCWICQRPIDYDLHWKDKMSFTADHVKAIAVGGSMTGELRPAHRGCNSRRGVGRELPSVKPLTTSTDWYNAAAPPSG